MFPFSRHSTKSMSLLTLTSFVACFLFLMNPLARAQQLKMPAIFSDHMVVQRELPVPVWGWDVPGQEITVGMNGVEVNGRADDRGQWQVKLPAQEAGGPYEIMIKGSSTLRYSDVMIGEVWICSGQSNMEWSVARSNNAGEETATADHSDIRLFTVEHQINFLPAKDLTGVWEVCSPETIGPFSAVAYYFGRDLRDELKVPIGLINTTWGGSMIEPWMSAEAFENDKLKDRVEEIQGLDYEEMKLRSEKDLEEWLALFENSDKGLKERWMEENANTEASNTEAWNTMDIPVLWESAGHPDLDGVVWFRRSFDLDKINEEAYTLHLGPIDDSDRTYINGHLIGETKNRWDAKREYEVPAGYLRKGRNTLVVRVEDTGGGGGMYGNATDYYLASGKTREELTGGWTYRIGTDRIPPRPPVVGHNYGPTVLYNGMVDPLVPYAFRGAIWYQGESNTSQPERYAELFPMMIRNWRSQWGQGDFPFLFVQLANFMQEVEDPNKESNWAELRGAQTKTLSVKNTGMAVAIDIGEADDIHPRNKQEVGRRLALAAKKIAYGRDLIYSGPVLKTTVTDQNKVKIRFEHTGTGLMVKNGREGLRGFAVAGKDGKYFKAEARLNGKHEVIVWHPEVMSPRYVKYAWANNPGELDLVNSAGLPVIPFKTELD